MFQNAKKTKKALISECFWAGRWYGIPAGLIRDLFSKFTNEYKQKKPSFLRAFWRSGGTATRRGSSAIYFLNLQLNINKKSPHF